MKYLQYIFLVLFIPLALSCRKDPSLEVPHPNILFSPVVTVETKDGFKPDNPATPDGSQANLFGIRVTNTTSSVFEPNEILEYDGSSYWTYTPLKNWETTGHYYFASVFPAPAVAEDVQFNNNSTIRIVYKPSNNYDMMLARADRDRSNGGGTEAVELPFKHTCSAVRFLFGASSNDYVISAFKVIGLAQRAELTVPIIPAGPTDIRDGWGSYYYHDDLFIYPTHSQGETYPTTVPVVNPSAPLNPDNFAQFGWYYMLPQTMLASSAVSFSVRKIISDDQGQPVYGDPITTVLSITDRDGIPGADTWIPNDVYNYFITISQKDFDIIVKATSWVDVQATTDDLTFEPD